MSGNKRAAATATNKTTTKKAKQISAATMTPSAQGNSKAARNASSTTTPDKRKRTAPSTDGPASSKKQKTNGLPAAASTVVPATPGMRVDGSGASPEAIPNTASQDGHGQDEAAPKVLFLQEIDGQKAQGQSKAAKKAKQQQQQQQPSTLPLEPHAAILADLRPRRDVLMLSVLSSSKMEKRIASVLRHLGRPSLADGTSAAATPPTPPGVVLLHARSADSGKLISVAEIAKRRIREGFYREDAQSDGHTTALAWYQYNRLYDVQTEVKEGDKENADDEDEDDFQPMPQQFRAAVGDAAARQTVTRTYMSVILSRVALPELLKHSDITCQASADPIEREYQSWMIPGAEVS